jgi:hypothetical protein
LQRHAEIVVRVGEIGLQLQRVPVEPRRFVMIAERGGDKAAIAPASRVGGIDYEGVFQQSRRGGVQAALMMQHAEVMQRFGMAWVKRECLPIERLGFIEPAGAMRGDRRG